VFQSSTLTVSSIFFLQDRLHNFRVSITKMVFGKVGKPKPGAVAPTHLNIYVTCQYTHWQKAVLQCLAGLFDPSKHDPETLCGFPADTLNIVKNTVLSNADLKPYTKKVMELANTTVYAHKGRSTPLPSLSLQIRMNEYNVWNDNLDFVRKSLGIPNIQVLRIEDEGVIATDPNNSAKDVILMDPSVYPYHVKE
jgi:hypothetical protein